MITVEQYKELMPNSNCLVIGDIMIDEYVFGEVKRISPEAPVPVVRMRERKYVLGGAANVAVNMRSLGVKVTLVGAIGNDHEAGIFRGMLNAHDIRFEGVVSERRITTLKTRIIGKNHQIVRVDKEQTDAICAADEALFLEKIHEMIAHVNVIVLSDYKKGVCTERICRFTIDSADKYNKPVIVDPKQSDWTRYINAFLITPNIDELKEAANRKELNSAEEVALTAKKLYTDFQMKNILVTRSQDGMMLVCGSEVFDFQSEAQEVSDVSGAGDTVVAAVAAFLSVGADLDKAVKFSNVAAGISVSKLGTYAVTFNELAMRLDELRENKLVTKALAVEYLNNFKKQGKKIVFTNGCFDILHMGHITLLSKAKKLGDILIVGLNSDESIRRLKGKARPVNSETDRALMLSALEAVDFVVLFQEDTPYELIQDIIPDILVKGADYTPETVSGQDIVIEAGGQVVLLPLVEGKSTSCLIQFIKDKE